MSDAGRRRAKASKTREYLTNLTFPAGAVLFALVLWWAFVVGLKIPHYILPNPVDIIRELFLQSNLLLEHSWVTLYEALAGFILAIIVGFPIAMLLVWAKSIEKTLMPLLVFLQTFPKIAIVPLLVIWLGFGVMPKIFISFVICLFPIIINTSVGLASVESEMLELIQSMKATKFQVFSKVRIPNSFPYLLSALKISITLALIGAIVGEFYAGDKGLGYIIVSSHARLQTSLLFADILVLVFMGAALFYIIAGLERVIIPWKPAAEEAGRTLTGGTA